MQPFSNYERCHSSLFSLLTDNVYIYALKLSTKVLGKTHPCYRNLTVKIMIRRSYCFYMDRDKLLLEALRIVNAMNGKNSHAINYY